MNFLLQKYPTSLNADGTATEKHEFHSLYFHKLGTDASEDFLVFERRDDPNWMWYVVLEN